MLCYLLNDISRRPERSFLAGYSHPLWTQLKPGRPFAQFNGWRFIGFTLTLLTLTTTPTNGHAPYFLQPPSEHALFTRSLLSYWLQLRTHSAVIGWVLPPAGACCEVCFSFFSTSLCFTHTAERKGSQSEKKTTSTQTQHRQQHWQPPSLCSVLALKTKKWYKYCIPQCHRENLQRWTLKG